MMPLDLIEANAEYLNAEELKLYTDSLKAFKNLALLTHIDRTEIEQSVMDLMKATLCIPEEASESFVMECVDRTLKKLLQIKSNREQHAEVATASLISKFKLDRK